MNKTIVLYQSKYGATEKYAQWLAEELTCDLMETKEATIEQVHTYDTIILGGGIYASGIRGISFLKKHYPKIKDKILVVFAVGASPYDEKAMAALRERNFKQELADVPCFYYRGAWNEDKMTWLDRNLCRMLKKVVAKKDPANYEPWEAALMEAEGNMDWTDRAAITPIVEYIR